LEQAELLTVFDDEHQHQVGCPHDYVDYIPLAGYVPGETILVGGVRLRIELDRAHCVDFVERHFEIEDGQHAHEYLDPVN